MIKNLNLVQCRYKKMLFVFFFSKYDLETDLLFLFFITIIIIIIKSIPSKK